MTPLQYAHSNIGHDYFACQARYDQLSGWLRLIKFLSLSAAPGLLLIIFQTENPTVIKIGSALVAIGVVPLWIWDIFSLVYGWDRQLATAKLVAKEGKKIFERLSTERLDVVPMGPDMEQLCRRVQELHDYVVDDGVSVSAEVNMFAQQKVMSQCKYHCTNCNQSWHQRAVLPPANLKKLNRDVKASRRCFKCGQPLKN